MKENLISILISTLNPVEKFLKECLDSIFNQTYTNFEIVLVDDGSDKIDIFKWLKEEKYNLDKIKYVKLGENKGTAKALNIGIDYCEGEYIAKIDDDDVMMPRRLEKQFKYVKENKLDGCFCYYERINQESNIVSKKEIRVKEKDFFKQLLFKGNVFCHSTMFISKETLIAVGKYDSNLKYDEDFNLYIKVFGNNYKLGLVREYLVKYRINDYRNPKYREVLSSSLAIFSVSNYFANKKSISLSEKIKLIIIYLKNCFYCIRLSKK